MLMKRTPHTIYGLLPFATFLVSAALLAACSPSADDTGSSGIPDSPAATGYSISFNATDSTHITTRSTRSTGLNSLGYDEIVVYGYKTLGGTIQNVMPGYTLKYVPNTSSTTNTTGWEYVGQGKDYLGLDQEIKYWDGNSTDYRFFAVLKKFKDNVKYNGSAITSATNVTTTGSFSMEFDNLEYMTHTKDDKYYKSDGTTEVKEADIPMYGALWQGNPSEYYNKPVELAFVKPYSLVRLVFERPDGSSTTVLGKEGVTDKYITFGPKNGSTMAGDGKVAVNWGMTGNSETATATKGSTTLPTMTVNPLTLTDQNVRYQAWPEYLMIPSTDDPVDFVCTAYVYTKNSSGQDVFDPRTAVIPAAYMKWRPGYQYTYVFKITSNSGLEFSHAVEVFTKWQAGYADRTQW